MATDPLNERRGQPAPLIDLRDPLGIQRANRQGREGHAFLLRVIREKLADPNYPAQLKDNLRRLEAEVANGRMDAQSALARVERINQKYQEIKAGTRGAGRDAQGNRIPGMGLGRDDGIMRPDGEGEEPPYTGPNYIDMLKEQMARARSNVEANFGAALQEIQNAEGQTNMAAAAAPGVINDRYAAAQANQNTNASALFNAVQQSGLGQFAQPTQEATMAPLQQALTLDQAAAMTGIDFTKMGLGQYYAQQRKDLATQRAQMMADLDQQDVSTMADYYENEADRQEAARQRLAEGQGVVPAFGKREVSQALGGEILSSAQNPQLYAQGVTDFQPGAAEILRQKPAYTATQNKLQRAVKAAGKGKKGKAKRLVNRATTGRRALNHPKAASLALADNPGLLGYFQPKG